jgi:hypothetical protein
MMKAEYIPAGFRVSVETIGYDGGDIKTKIVHGLHLSDVNVIRDMLKPYRVDGDFLREINASSRIALQTKFLQEYGLESKAMEFGLIGYNGLPRLVQSLKIARFDVEVEITHYSESDLS